MTYITDTQVDQSCATLRKAIEAAENSNHAGEVFVVAAANATALVEALEDLLPIIEEIAEREGLTAPCKAESLCGDVTCAGFGCLVMKAANANTALTLAKGGRV